jgi:hypothetical protein
MEDAGGGEAVLGAPSAGIHAEGDWNGANLLGEYPNDYGQAAVARASADSLAKRGRGRPRGSGGSKRPAAPAASGGADGLPTPVQEAVAVADRYKPKLKDCPIEYVDAQKRAAKFEAMSYENKTKFLDRDLSPAEAKAFEWKNCEAYVPIHDAWPKYAKRGKFINLHRTPHISELQCFLAFFPNTLWRLHLQETNRYIYIYIYIYIGIVDPSWLIGNMATLTVIHGVHDAHKECSKVFDKLT